MIFFWGLHNMSNFFSKFLFADGSNLDRGERIVLFVMILLPLFVLDMIFYLFTFDFWFFYFFIFESIVCFLYFLPFIFRDKFEEKYGVYSKIRLGNTYQYTAISLGFWGIDFILILFFVFYFINKALLGFFIISAFIIPVIVAFLRTNLFNDSQSVIGDDIVLGFNPIYYLFSCLIIGLFGFYIAYLIYGINECSTLILIIVTLFWQFLLVIPDKVNSIFPYEIRTIFGFLLYVILILISFILIIYSIVGSSIWIFPSLTLEQLIYNILTCVFGVGLFILFYHQARNMGKKN